MDPTEHPISIADEPVGQITQIEQTVPLSIIAFQPCDFHVEQDAHSAES